ncbi:MaoC/PaaZ C-terminal domain-containing protein [Micromonospora lupini]|uniref:MaoC/PaaZ C-terminal domain-containing protein n=1 Tax=Micromonospora lupini TaxID=285679 RepID=UPI0022543FB6|nr:MaoC/PaaZ C-terminal domain-containing protein [Micromonospora lupini]MCX5069243.1 MaoC/PaaZ C-terminal domain-containing protein [Micromonospora lupini]
MTPPATRSGTGAPAELFFEDLVPGLTVDLGTVTVDGDEMLAFARRFDPQWYHVDPQLAEASRHGGVIASGFYTVSLFMRAYVDHLLSRAAADASPGLEELRWLAPVRAGDRLAVRVDVMGARPSAARPGLGTVILTGTMLRLGPDNRPEQEVLRTRFRGWFALRAVEANPDATPAEGGPSEAGPSEAGPSEAGPAETGSSQNGPSQNGPAESGPAEAQAGPSTAAGPPGVEQRA